jgi:hypothetical protein
LKCTIRRVKTQIESLLDPLSQARQQCIEHGDIVRMGGECFDEPLLAAPSRLTYVWLDRAADCALPSSRAWIISRANFISTNLIRPVPVNELDGTPRRWIEARHHLVSYGRARSSWPGSVAAAIQGGGGSNLYNHYM